MNLLIIRLIAMALAIYIVGNFTRLFRVEGFVSALLAAVVLAIVNSIIRPFIVFLTLPITIVTLGLFLFIVNGISLIIVSKFVSGFKIEGCLTAAIAAILISFVNLLIEGILI